jgi:hypothetical protein
MIANKNGARYLYYVWKVVLRKHSPGPLGRVPASKLEALVVDALRRHLQGNGTDEETIPESNRDLIERYLLRRSMRKRRGCSSAASNGSPRRPAARRPYR